MYKTLRIAFLVALLFVIVGCAGKNFIRPNTDSFKLGQTTYSQIMEQLGEPRRVGEVVRNGNKIKSITYSYATTFGEPLDTWVIPARALEFFFYNDTLVGQQFISSFKSDNTDFDEAKISSLIKGQTTRAEVIQLLGSPSATYIPPMAKETSGEAFGYNYVTTRKTFPGGLKIFRKSLQITFDEKGLVSDTDYASSGVR